MSAEVKKEIGLEIGHVLFIDIIGYSKLLINEQSEQLQTLKQIVRQLNAVIAGIELLDAAMDVAQVIGLDLKGRSQPSGIANQNATALKRLEQPFVRVERNGIRTLEMFFG